MGNDFFWIFSGETTANFAYLIARYHGHINKIERKKKEGGVGWGGGAREIFFFFQKACFCSQIHYFVFFGLNQDSQKKQVFPTFLGSFCGFVLFFG